VVAVFHEVLVAVSADLLNMIGFGPLVITHSLVHLVLLLLENGNHLAVAIPQFAFQFHILLLLVDLYDVCLLLDGSI